MSSRFAIVIVVLLSMRSANAELPPSPDELSAAYQVALTELKSGKRPQLIADRLKPVGEKHSKSPHAALAVPFLRDLTASSKNPPTKPNAPPERRLAYSRVPFSLLKYAENWCEPLKELVEKHRKDPTTQLILADRNIIARLIPLLTDRTPTRPTVFSSYSWMIKQPRVCDLALSLIEYHAKARFHHDTIQSTYLHQLPDAEHKTLTQHVVSWWDEVKDKSVAAGIRAQLPHGRTYPERVWMAKTLAQHAQPKSDDRQFAINFLIDIVKNNRGHVGAHAANALAEFGDKSAVDLFYNAWKTTVRRRRINHSSGVAFYLCKHGRRREWELLHAISFGEVRDKKGPGAGAIWACVVNSGVAGKNPYAIPILGLALHHTKNTGSRWTKSGGQSFSDSDSACELLQKQVPTSFGYQVESTAAERLAAIKKAQACWEKEGKAKYSCDYIEREMTSKDASKSQ